MHQLSCTPSRVVKYWARSEVEKFHDYVNVGKSFYNDNSLRVNLSDKSRTVRNCTFSQSQRARVLKSLDWFLFISKKEGRKVCMVTLTLSGKQMHSTNFLNKNALNQFLTELRSRKLINRYVWKLEFQKNGNVHWHILVDNFVPWQIVRGIWNRIQKKLGYISEYKKRFGSMTVDEYVRWSVKHTSLNSFKSVDAYRKGVHSRWSNPNSIDVRLMMNVKSVKSYCSKYMAKLNNVGSLLSVSFVDNNKEAFRSFGCSRSISRIGNVCVHFSYKMVGFWNEMKRCGCLCQKYDYAESRFLRAGSMPKDLIEWYHTWLFGQIYETVNAP